MVSMMRLTLVNLFFFGCPVDSELDQGLEGDVGTGAAAGRASG
jgi:hypothetical protein